MSNKVLNDSKKEREAHMFRKHCDRCNRPSYSSSESGEWICPVCYNNLTDYPLFNAMTIDRINENAILTLIKNKKHSSIY